jgi:hypothetical protein
VCVQYASQILTKEMLLKPATLEPLGQEERAVVDWLILKEAKLAGVRHSFCTRTWLDVELCANATYAELLQCMQWGGRRQHSRYLCVSAA